MTQYPQTIPEMKMHTLGTIQGNQYQFGGVIPRRFIQNDNIDLTYVSQNPIVRDLPVMQESLFQRFQTASKMPDQSIYDVQKKQGAPVDLMYNNFIQNNSSPTNYNWSTTPMKNLMKSVNTIQYKYDGASWTEQNPSRSEYRTSMGGKITDQATRLRSVRLY